jgi:hypothetical protein
VTSEKHDHDHSVRSANYPHPNRTTILHARCELCRMPFLGGVFQLRCDRSECAKAEGKDRLKGARRGTLLVTQHAGNGAYWRCRCDCGKAVIKSEAYLDSRRPTCGEGCPNG